MCDAPYSTAATNDIAPLVTDLCYEAPLPACCVGEASSSDLWVLACRKLGETELTLSHSAHMCAGTLSCCWGGNDVYLSCCCYRLCTAVSFVEETSLSELGDDASVGSVIRIARPQLAMLSVACTRIYLESLDYYQGKSVIDSEKNSCWQNNSEVDILKHVWTGCCLVCNL